ncbi:FecR domain-containing protein [Chryseobacterium sp.]|uniref:FecR family protein n=1 Tax=Chryseobacterium sp. TaxID=1871047 RepID=UPI00333F58E8
MAYMDELFNRYLNNGCSEEEIKILLRYFEIEEYSDKLSELVKNEFLREEISIVHMSDSRKDMIQRVEKTLMSAIVPPLKRRNSQRLLTAISIAAMLFVVFGVYFYISRQYDRSTAETAMVFLKNIEPGTNKATLILENGKQIALDENNEAIKTGKNEITYLDGTTVVENNSLQYVTLATPRKGQYKVTLPDGTKVWLNAESSLKYPTQFTGRERIVELQGEAYFEVAHNAAKPFRVKSTEQEIVVLGTRFNVSAYPTEKPVTTLIEGRVRLRSENAKEVFLAPGQQSELGKEAFKVQNVQTEDYLSWMQGEFVFNNTELDKVFNALERWYDVTFEYPPELAHQHIYAEINRKRKLSDVLRILEDVTGLSFKITERRVIVKK